MQQSPRLGCWYHWQQGWLVANWHRYTDLRAILAGVCGFWLAVGVFGAAFLAVFWLSNRFSTQLLCSLFQ